MVQGLTVQKRILRQLVDFGDRATTGRLYYDHSQNWAGPEQRDDCISRTIFLHFSIME